MTVAVRTREKNFANSQGFRITLLEKQKTKKNRKDAAFSALREHTGQAAKPLTPGIRAELWGRVRAGERTEGHQRPALPCTSSRVTSEPQFPFLTSTRGCPGGAPKLHPPRALPPATT